MLTVSVRVFENDNTIPLLGFEAAEVGAAPTVILGNPEAATLVGRDCDRVLHIGLCGKDLKLETVGKLYRLADFRRSHWRGCRFFGIGRHGKFVGKRGADNKKCDEERSSSEWIAD